jgi:hypothetical protein
MTRDENDRRNDIRIEREEAFMHGLGLTLIIAAVGLLCLAIYFAPWQLTATVSAFLVLPFSNLARKIWQQRSAS